MSKQVDLINHMKKVLLKLFNLNKDGLYEGSFFWGSVWPCTLHISRRTNLISIQLYTIINLKWCQIDLPQNVLGLIIVTKNDSLNSEKLIITWGHSKMTPPG